MRTRAVALLLAPLLLLLVIKSACASNSRDASVYGVDWEDLDDGVTTLYGDCLYCDEGDVFSGVQAPFDHLLSKVRATARSAHVAEALRGRRSLNVG